MATLLTAVYFALLAVFFKVLKDALFSKSHPRPPGPKPLPFIGNLLDLPRGTLSERVFAQWSEKWGVSFQYTLIYWLFY